MLTFGLLCFRKTSLFLSPAFFCSQQNAYTLNLIYISDYHLIMSNTWNQMCGDYYGSIEGTIMTYTLVDWNLSSIFLHPSSFPLSFPLYVSILHTYKINISHSVLIANSTEWMEKFRHIITGSSAGGGVLKRTSVRFTYIHQTG